MQYQSRRFDNHYQEECAEHNSVVVTRSSVSTVRNGTLSDSVKVPGEIADPEGVSPVNVDVP